MTAPAPTDIAPILIVDDSQDDVELFQIGLEQLNLVNPIHVCRDGVDALDYLLRRGAWSGRTGPQPLLTLLDIKMPRMDGLELLGHIRAHPDIRLLPVVVMTSSNQSRDVTASYAAQANGFLVKPVDFEQLVACAKAVGMYWALYNRPPAPPEAI